MADRLSLAVIREADWRLPRSSATACSAINQPSGIANDQPRDVVFRHNARLGNHQFPLLGFEADDEVDAETATGPISLLLVHGHKQLHFAHFGIPHAYHQRGYVYQTPNLMQVLYEVGPPDSAPPEKEVSVDELMSLKEEIARHLKDHGGA